MVTPVDLETRAGEEFLIARTAGGDRLRVRLDHILQATTLPAGGPAGHSEPHQ